MTNNNYFYDLPDDLQEMIWHKIYQSIVTESYELNYRNTSTYERKLISFIKKRGVLDKFARLAYAQLKLKTQTNIQDYHINIYMWFRHVRLYNLVLHVKPNSFNDNEIKEFKKLHKVKECDEIARNYGYMGKRISTWKQAFEVLCEI